MKEFIKDLIEATQDEYIQWDNNKTTFKGFEVTVFDACIEIATKNGCNRYKCDTEEIKAAIQKSNMLVQAHGNLLSFMLNSLVIQRLNKIGGIAI